jgi:hypothetical protein
MEAKGVDRCALCRNGTYNVEDLNVVFLPSVVTGASVGREGRSMTKELTVFGKLEREETMAEQQELAAE